MNCTRCNTPMETNARFCPSCGLPVSAPASNGGAMARPSPLSQPTSMNEAPTIPPTPAFQQTQAALAPSQQPWSQPQSIPATQAAPAPSQQPWSQPQPQSIPPTQAAPQAQYQYQQSARPPYPQDGRVEAPPRRRRFRWRSCLLAGLSALVVIILLSAAAWTWIIRPYVNGLVKDELNTTLANAVNHIDPIVSSRIPAGPYKVKEDTLNNLVVLNSSSSDPVQNMHIRITPEQIRIDFQVYGFACAVTGIPKAQNGQLVMTNVNIEGIASQFITPDEITMILDKHLVDARSRLGHPINGAALEESVLDLTLGAPDNTIPGGGGGLPTPP